MGPLKGYPKAEGEVWRRTARGQSGLGPMAVWPGLSKGDGRELKTIGITLERLRWALTSIGKEPFGSPRRARLSSCQQEPGGSKRPASKSDNSRNSQIHPSGKYGWPKRQDAYVPFRTMARVPPTRRY